MHRFVSPRMQYVSYTTPVGEFKPVWFSKVKQMLKYLLSFFILIEHIIAKWRFLKYLKGDQLC